MTADHAPSDEVESVALWLGPPDRPVFAWLDLPDDDFVAGIAVICPTMGLEAGVFGPGPPRPGATAGRVPVGRAAAGLRRDGRLGRHLDGPRPRRGVAA